MRKLKLQMQISLDGFVAGPNGEMDWMVMDWSEDLNQYVAGIVADIDTIVLGRKLAEGFIPYWAGVAADPAHPEYDGGRIFTNTPKVVFTRSLEQSIWDNTILAKGAIADEVRQLKQQAGKSIYACGGAQFVSSLIRHHLIDEYFLLVNPSAIGVGLTIFKEAGDRRQLQLVEAVPFACGIVAMHYRPK